MYSARAASGAARLCALRLALCGAASSGGFACRPTEISEARFQARAQTCYPYPTYDDAGVEELGDAGRPLLKVPTNCQKEEDLPAVSTPPLSAAVPSGGLRSAPGSASGAAQGGSAAAAARASTDAGAVGAGAGAGTGDAGSAAPPVDRADPEPLPSASGPECDATAIFNKPAEMGGCSDVNGSGGCHESGGTGTKPDLQSIGVARRLYGGHSDLVITADTKGTDCAYVEAEDRIWITPGYDESASFLWKKITSDESDVPCGKPMPDDEPPLSDDSKECIRKWIEWVALYGGQ